MCASINTLLYDLFREILKTNTFLVNSVCHQTSVFAASYSYCVKKSDLLKGSIIQINDKNNYLKPAITTIKLYYYIPSMG